MADSIYLFTANRLGGSEISLEGFKGKVLLIVNTASQCGFTPQYIGLENLYKKYQAQGFEILGFPCNQFGAQEPGSAEEIATFCETRYHVTFPMFTKIEVNGNGAHPLYQFLRSKAKGFLGTERIKWNFTKFLINKEGEVMARFAPVTKPEELEDQVKRLLDSKN